jgi:hypothetical protein
MAAIALNHIESGRWRQKYNNTWKHLPLSAWTAGKSSTWTQE